MPDDDKQQLPARDRTVKITVSLPVSLVLWIDTVASQTGLPRSTALALLLRQTLPTMPSPD